MDHLSGHFHDKIKSQEISRISRISRTIGHPDGGRGALGPHRNFVVIAPMTMKFGTGIKLDVFYTMVTKKIVTSLLLRNYDVITCILAEP